jgi:Kef-type K+ transport system membrane component KefB
MFVALQAAVAIAEDWPLVTGLLVPLLLAKFVAAWLAGWLCKDGTAERLMMWSLSLPQVAATLAAALVAYQTTNAAGERLIDLPVLNASFELVLLTATRDPPHASAAIPPAGPRASAGARLATRDAHDVAR